MHSQQQCGTTMLEIVIMGMVMSLLLVMITQSIASLSKTRAESRTHAELHSVADRYARQIETDVSAAARLFTDTAVDREYLQAMSVGSELIGAGNQLPVLTNVGLFDRDPTGIRETGNIVFLGSRRDRIAVTVDTATGPATYYAQTYQFTICTTRSNGDRIDALRWVSSPLVAYWDLMEIESELDRTAALTQLRDSGLRYAWDPKADRANGLFAVLAAGAMTPLSPDDRVSGAYDERGVLITASRPMRVVPNQGITQLPVPEFATPAGAFPGGFEVKIDGGPSGKLLLFRMVLESTIANERRVFAEVRRIVLADG